VYVQRLLIGDTSVDLFDRLICSAVDLFGDIQL